MTEGTYGRLVQPPIRTLGWPGAWFPRGLGLGSLRTWGAWGLGSGPWGYVFNPGESGGRGGLIPMPTSNRKKTHILTWFPGFSGFVKSKNTHKNMVPGVFGVLTPSPTTPHESTPDNSTPNKFTLGCSKPRKPLETVEKQSKYDPKNDPKLARAATWNVAPFFSMESICFVLLWCC